MCDRLLQNDPVGDYSEIVCDLLLEREHPRPASRLNHRFWEPGHWKVLNQEFYDTVLLPSQEPQKRMNPAKSNVPTLQRVLRQRN